jgi:single-stranded DNA-binding protein
MSYLNLANVCQFEGRLVADPEVGSINTQKGPITKVRFKLAVDKVMDKNAKAAAAQNGQPTADFPMFEVVGPKADFVKNWLTKGKPCKVLAAFRTYDYMDNNANPPVKKFGWSFDVVDVTFTVSDSGARTGGAQGGNGNAGGNGGYNAPADNFVPIDDGDMPF